MKGSYPGFESQEDLRQKQDEAFQADGEVLENKISDPHSPDQIEEVKAVNVGLSKHKAVGKRNSTHFLLTHY